MKLNMGYEFYSSAEKLDPANIKTLYESNLIENLFSRILEYDTQGELICVLCKKFWIEDSVVNFEFREDVFTVDGYNINALDAENSLKRLINKETNTHGNLKNFIDISNPESIKSYQNTLKIKLLKPHYSQFLLPLLASMDFSIIPSRVLEEEKESGKIDMKNTSGPYYLFKDDPEGKLILAANKKHPLYSKDMPQNIQIVPVEFGSGINDFLSGKIDVLDITYYPRFSEYEKLFSQQDKKFSYHKTTSINLFLVLFNPKNIEKFSKKQLFYAANIISKTFLSFKNYGYGFKETYEFFQANGMGHLTKDQFDQLSNIRQDEEKVHFEKPIELGISGAAYDKVKKAFEPYPEIVVRKFESNPAFIELSQRPDVFVLTTDSSFNEDISLLSYNLSMEYLGMSKEEGIKWINDLIQIPEKYLRIKKIQELQLNILTKPYIYPVGSSPYWAIANSNLKLNFSELFPGSSWWKIREE